MPTGYSAILIGFITAAYSCVAWSYPEFIGYGYNSCLTCHYNGNGGGPLTDYGRALWSAEIAARWLYPRKTTDEEIANQSGFLGSVELPSWLRPHAKYRGLELIRNPRGTASRPRYFHMQADVGATLQDSDGRYVVTGTWSRMLRQDDNDQMRSGFKRFLAREYYARVRVAEKWFVYAGLIEKVYGLRNIDHNSYQRTYQGFNQVLDSVNGVTHSQGVIVQRIDPDWDFSVQYFIGNPYESVNSRARGFSFMTEFGPSEKRRFGFSGYSSQSHLLRKNIFALHYRQALSKGSALLSEIGWIEDRLSSSSATKGAYAFIEPFVLIDRGVNFKGLLEYYRREFKNEAPHRWRVGFGFLIFPIARLELRADAALERQLSSQTATQDSWLVLGQVHVSL